MDEGVLIGTAEGAQRSLIRERLLGRPEALADHVAEVVPDDVVLGLDDLREAGYALGRVCDRAARRPVRSRTAGQDRSSQPSPVTRTDFEPLSCNPSQLEPMALAGAHLITF